MSVLAQFRQRALAFPEVEEQPDHEKTLFQVAQKSFATLSEPDQRVCLKLSELDQSLFTDFDANAIYAVPDPSGQEGWTYVELDSVPESVVADALTAAYCHVAPRRLAQPYLDAS
ncbi:YjbR protein [Catalinimonas alkaloidigena]|uniref:YjbR protein n=1 Tax=Catalinimonas alkaloidigena TaxID=1075417 RepID=A0A1G9RS18_9BACT|nr:MmcQ/YjbR family DNA-binding protein [Catalinimonas alkaloidigena]SDM25295.1 YjbR protein [Catalinimonas alkaloidigena]